MDGTSAPAATGCLYLCATPLGNLEDVTLRLLRVLGECAVIAAEDTRVTRKLLSRYDIHTPLASCHQHTPSAQIERLVDRLRAGEDVALVCNAGTPTISDPGGPLVEAAVESGIPLIPIPGPAAVTAALSIAGLPTPRFWFQGFLPRRGAARRQSIARLASLPEGGIVVYESPHRLAATLGDLREALGDRQAVVCRELTKKFEEVVRGRLGELLGWAADGEVKGEVTVVLGPRDDESDDPGSGLNEEALVAALRETAAAGLSTRDAVREVSARFGARRNQVYRLAQEVLREDAGH